MHFLSLCFSLGISHSLTRDMKRGLLFVSAIAMWKRRGKKIWLGFDLRSTAGPKDEKMKLKAVLGFAMAAFVAWGAFAETTTYNVKNVQAHQRYPWNGKVDIDFLIDCTNTTANFKVTVQCTDHKNNTNVVMKTIKYNDSGSAATSFTLKAGQHRLTWDADTDLPNKKLSSVSFSVLASLQTSSETAEYLVINLSGGPTATSYPVTALSSAPSGGWTDLYKTTRLVLRRCPAGADPLGRYTLTKDFYAGVFEVTQKQWELVMGTADTSWSTSYGKGNTYPAYYVSYNDIRGSSDGAKWPSSSSVDADSFIGKLRTKTGLSELDLPTEAQWEYACRAGTTTTYNTGDDEAALASSGWYSENSDDTTHTVGMKTANDWGLYDMHGNVWEWCLDWYGGALTSNDPIGAASDSYRRLRGGSWYFSAGYAASSYRDYSNPSYDYCNDGFRLFRTVP